MQELFKMSTELKPKGDQPEAIEALVNGVNQGMRDQILLGVTGSGKTFTMANVIKHLQRPALIIAHNKTLAAQLCAEFKEFFPESAVGYFVSYYDYYQPEAYIASTDTYIEKDSAINDEIDRLRHSATAWLTERRDVIIVASVSCIYAMGNPEEYAKMTLSLREGMNADRDNIIRKLIDMQYSRNDFELERGTFRVRGDVMEVLPIGNQDKAMRVEFFGDQIDRISEINTVTGTANKYFNHIMIFPATHYTTTKEQIDAQLGNIENDLYQRIDQFKSESKLIEAQRIMQRTNYDIEMIKEIGYCTGIENYSRYFDGREPGDPPYTLLDYFKKDSIVFIDEAHVTIPQIGAMFNGDFARKTNLVEYGFRLPSAFDNRPLRFHEFEQRINQCIYVSATPGKYELARASQIVEQIIRPTGLIDPEIIVRPATGQIDDLLSEIHKVVATGNRVLVTTLTKRMAENLTAYFKEMDVRVRYLHSDVQTMERIEILHDLRKGEFDVLVGINLLREGLDLPEVSLVAILDADKEGFLRSETSLIQTIGRAARNVEGKVIMYADNLTNSMIKAIGETNRRRAIQQAFNEANGITPTSVRKAIREIMEVTRMPEKVTPVLMDEVERQLAIENIEEMMLQAAANLDFEKAAKLRDDLFQLKGEKVPKNMEQTRRLPKPKNRRK